MTFFLTPETTKSTERFLFLNLRALRDLSGKFFFALLAIAAGLGIALLPLKYAAAVLAGGALLAAALMAPLVGLAIMLLIGLTEPLLGAAGLLPFSVGQATLLLFSGSWLLRGLILRQIRWPALPITVYFCLYLFAAALSVFISQPPSPKDSATELLKWIEMYLIAGIVAEAAGRQRLGWVIAILFLAGAFQAAVGIWQFQFRGHGPEGFRILGDHYRAYGTLEQPNPFGGFMGLVWPLAAALAAYMGLSIIRRRRGTQINADKTQMNTGFLNRENQRLSFSNLRHLCSVFLLVIGTASLTLGALVLSFSRGAWLGAAAAGLAMLIAWPRRRRWGLALGGGGVIMFFALYNLGLLPSFIASRFADVGDFVQVYDVRGVHINDSNFSIIERLAHWQAALNMADARPLFGVGVGNYEAAYEDYRLINWRYALGHAHIIYLNVLAETGVLGLAAYLLLWGAIIGLTWRVSRRAEGVERALAIGLLGGWVHLSTHQLLDNLYVGNIPLTLGALLGVLCILTSQISTRTQPLTANR